MLKLSKLTDYAVVLLSQMAARNGSTISTTPRLCEATGLPQPTVSKILKILTRGGLLKAQRGASGGYALAKAAREISLADIVKAMDGPIHLTECAEDTSHGCQMSYSCAMHGRWNKVNQVIRSALENVSLHDMALPPPLAHGRDGPSTRAEAR
jgi:FeS assembly SUF system regulator